MNDRLLQRKAPAHYPPVVSHNRSIIVFMTVCTDKRKPILANDEVHRLLVQSWQVAESWLVGRYVVMPDHVHLFCAPNSLQPVPLEQWVHLWKSRVSRRWPRPAEQPVWQKSFWDSQLRRGDNYSNKWEYVRQNPVRHGLAVKADHWAFQGELNVLDWHD